MTPLPFSPFIDISLVDPENRFVLDENRFFHDITSDDTLWSTGDDPPLFISDPSPDFIEACRRDILPTLEQFARLA